MVMSEAGNWFWLSWDQKGGLQEVSEPMVTQGKWGEITINNVSISKDDDKSMKGWREMNRKD